MKIERTTLHLDRMSEAAKLALTYIDGMDDPEFVTRRAELPWRQMTGMRNRIAHGYFDLNMRVVWETALTFLPQLLNRIPEIRAAESGDAGNPMQP
jgi:uncharacterized protein with HEPN domain